MKKNFLILAIGLTTVVGFVPHVWGSDLPSSSGAEFGKLSWSLADRADLGSGVLVETWRKDDVELPPSWMEAREARPSYVRPFRGSTRITVNSRRYGSMFFGYAGVPGEPAFGVPIYEHALFEEEVQSGARAHWLDPAGSSDETVTAGYAWRGMRIEGSAFRSHNGDVRTDARTPLALTSGRLSFRSDGNWSFQASRKRNNRLDDIAGDPERRTTVSAAYHRLWDVLEWKTTFAAGRLTSGEGKSPGQELLCESVMTLHHAHTLFARWERAAAADIFNQDERLRDQAFKAQKMTFGYVYDLTLGLKSRLDIGVIGSRGTSLAEGSEIYNENRKSYKIFTRLTMPY